MAAEDFSNSIYLRFERRQIISAQPISFSLLADPNRVFTTFSTLNITTPKPATAIIGFEFHLERLIDNASRLGILDNSCDEHQADWIRETTLSVIKRFINSHKDTSARIRLVLNKNGLEIFVGPYTARWPRGTTINAIFVNAQRAHTDIKSSAIEAATKAREQAEAQGAQEAFLVSNEGVVTEGSYTNIFWFDAKGTLFTVASGILPGVTRRIILSLAPCIEKQITPKELLNEASEIFVSQSTTGITPVIKVDEQIISSGRIGPHTLKLQDTFWDSLDKFSTIITQVK